MTTTKHTPSPTPRHFLAFGNTEAEKMKATGRYGMAANYRCACHSLSKFLHSKNKRDISFRQLTTTLMEDYQNWLWKNHVCRNTSSFYMRSLQAIYSKAVRTGIAEGNPFQRIYRGVAKTAKRAISADDIRDLRMLNLRAKVEERGYDPNSYRGNQLLQRMEFARDIFIFCFCARGLTFVDLAYLRKSDIRHGIIHYARRKTLQQLEVKVEPLMQEIIDRYATNSPYVFPIIKPDADDQQAYAQYRYRLQRYNKSLKMLSDMAEKDIKLTSYVSRHSWATNALYHQVPISIISQAMGHESVRTTAIYLKSFESSQIDQANQSIIASVFQES